MTTPHTPLNLADIKARNDERKNLIAIRQDSQHFGLPLEQTQICVEDVDALLAEAEGWKGQWEACCERNRRDARLIIELEEKLEQMQPLVEKLIWWSERQHVDSVALLVRNYRQTEEAAKD